MASKRKYESGASKRTKKSKQEEAPASLEATKVTVPLVSVPETTAGFLPSTNVTVPPVSVPPVSVPSTTAGRLPFTKDTVLSELVPRTRAEFLPSTSGSLPVVKDREAEFIERQVKLGNIFEEPSSPQHHGASSSAMIDKDWILELVSTDEHLFTPGVEETSSTREYRFLASHAGRFFCRVTGLGFVVESSGEVTYSFCSWEKAPKTPGSWSPAGPLFDVECPQGTLKELHLPHCEMSADEDLAVAHVTKNNMQILQPQEVTVKYVVISITGLSGFGVIRRNKSSKVRGQVLLLLRPKSQNLNVFLLPLNVPPDQVYQQMQHRQSMFIPTSSMCTLIHERQYRISCSQEAIKRIQPENQKFEYSYDQTIHPSFEVYLNRDVVEVELSVLEKRSSIVVWQRFINLTDAVLPSSSITEGEVQPTARSPMTYHHSGVAFVDKHRAAIIQKVSQIEPILDELYDHISKEQYDRIGAAKTKQEKCRKLYEVLNSQELKMLFFEALKRNESYLVSELEKQDTTEYGHNPG